MTQVGNLTVKLELDTTDFKAAIASCIAAVERLKKSIESLPKTISRGNTKRTK
jgi:hypothetical protein